MEQCKHHDTNTEHQRVGNPLPGTPFDSILLIRVAIADSVWLAAGPNLNHGMSVIGQSASQGFACDWRLLNEGNARIVGRVALFGVCHTYRDRENPANWTLRRDAWS